MNDELTGQLAGRNWQIPEYAQNCLYIETEHGITQTEGARGLFTLSAPAQWLTVRWGYDSGPALARLRWQPDSLEWDGRTRIGGAVEAVHLTGLPVLGTAVTVLHISGRPLRPNGLAYPHAEIRTKPVYNQPDFLESLPDDVEDCNTTWLVADDSPLMSLVHDAFLNGLRLWITGHLAEDESGWERFFALPLLLETVTLFAR